VEHRGGKRHGAGRKSRLQLSEREELLMRRALFLQDRALFRAICQHGRQGADGKLDDEEAYTRSVQQTAFGMLRLGAGADVYRWHLDVQDKAAAREKGGKMKTETTSILMAAMANLPGAQGQNGVIAAQIEHSESSEPAFPGVRLPGAVDIESIGRAIPARQHGADLFMPDDEAGAHGVALADEEAGAHGVAAAVPPGTPPLPHPPLDVHPHAENFFVLGDGMPPDTSP
jgi:hypothetical protein